MATRSCLLLLLSLALSLSPSTWAARDSQGKEFILAYMANTQWQSDPLNDIELFITTVSNTPASVTVTTPLFDPAWSHTFTVARGNIHTVKVPHQIRGVGVEKSNKGVRIQASEEVSVYSVNKEPKSTDAYISLPVDVLGTEYYAMTYTRDAEVAVVATQDNTQVSITWPTNAGTCNIPFGGTTYRNGDTLTLTLNKFETFHALQEDSGADFTGAYITSSKPVAVVSGNKKVAVPVNAGSADHLTEMLMPVDTWGTSFITTSTPDRSIGDVFRIVASEDGTTVTFSGGVTKTLSDAGDYKDVDVATGSYQAVTSDKPVMVAMFSKTWKNDGPHYGDPAMSLIIPEPQYASDYTWSSVKDPTGADFNNKVAVIIESSKKSGLRLDGNVVTWNEEKNVQGSTKIHLWARVSPGSHNIFHTDPSVTFMALVSGTFKVNSYAYAAGLRLALINTVCVPSSTVAGDIVDNDCDGRVDEEVLNNIDDDGDGLVDEDLATPPRVDGAWGSWGSYGSCSVSCGGSGTKTRTRQCDSPAPANNGLDCPNSGSETASCTTGACPINGNWGSWGSYGSCSVTCGSGSKSRTRQCDSPAPQHGGNNCAGSGTETASCTMPSCAVDGNWGSWGSYGSCSVTCGSGSKSRTRQCDSPAPQHGGNNCAGSGTETASCTMPACPINGNWGSWGSYGSCSVTCGSGSKSRTRQCDSPAPQHGGNNCAGSGTETASCTEPACSSCSGNVQADIVFILDASGSVGSSNFEVMKQFVRDLVHGFEVASHKVRVGVQKYSSGTNAEFHLHQYYDKNTVKAQVMNVVFTGGSTNTGGALDYMQNTMFSASNGDRAAVPNICVVLSDGVSNNPTYTASSAAKARNAGIVIFSIGIGSGIPTSELNDMATDPDVDHVFTVSGFSGLSGIRTQFTAQACVPPVPVDGAWSGWGSWGGCSVTCGGGSSSRSRACSSPPPANGGQQCPPPSAQTTACNPHPCPVDGGWGGWQAWSACSVTCMGVGVRGRTRSCDTPTPQHGGATCAGSADDSQTCDTRLTLCSVGNGWGPTVYSTTAGTPVDGGWGQWGVWTACTKTCGAGQRLRQRPCNNPVPQYGGSLCSGDFVQKEICGNLSCAGASSYVQTCPERFFDCASGNISCVHYLKKCDCVPDCDDASDEDQHYAGCVAANSICHNTAHSTTPKVILTAIFLTLAAILPILVTWSDVDN